MLKAMRHAVLLWLENIILTCDLWCMPVFAHSERGVVTEGSEITGAEVNYAGCCPSL